jgi:hypothetical protein
MRPDHGDSTTLGGKTGRTNRDDGLVSPSRPRQPRATSAQGFGDELVSSLPLQGVHEPRTDG